MVQLKLKRGRPSAVLPAGVTVAGNTARGIPGSTTGNRMQWLTAASVLLPRSTAPPVGLPATGLLLKKLVCTTSADEAVTSAAAD